MLVYLSRPAEQAIKFCCKGVSTMLQCQGSESAEAHTLRFEHACHWEVGPPDTDLDAYYAEVLRQNTDSNFARHRLKQVVMWTLHDKLHVPAGDPSAAL